MMRQSGSTPLWASLAKAHPSRLSCRMSSRRRNAQLLAIPFGTPACQLPKDGVVLTATSTTDMVARCGRALHASGGGARAASERFATEMKQGPCQRRRSQRHRLGHLLCQRKLPLEVLSPSLCKHPRQHTQRRPDRRGHQVRRSLLQRSCQCSQPRPDHRGHQARRRSLPQKQQTTRLSLNLVNQTQKQQTSVSSSQTGLLSPPCPL